jgi:hypothetical protein
MGPILANLGAIGALNVCAMQRKFMGETTIGGEHATIGFSDGRQTPRFFDLRDGPPHTLSVAFRGSRDA